MTVVNDGAVGERLPSLYTRLVQTLSDADPRYAVIFVWAGPHAHASARSVGGRCGLGGVLAAVACVLFCALPF